MNKPFKVMRVDIQSFDDDFSIRHLPIGDNNLQFKTLEEAKNYIKDFKAERQHSGFPFAIVEEVSSAIKKLVYIEYK